MRREGRLGLGDIKSTGTGWQADLELSHVRNVMGIGATS